MSKEWFVYLDEKQLGPYTEELLKQYVTENRITPDSLLWSEGMADWQKASTVLDLFPSEPAASPLIPAAVVSPKPAAQAWAPPGARVASAVATSKGVATSPYTAPTSMGMAAPAGGAYPFLSIKACSYGLWLGSIIAPFVLLIIGIIAMVGAAATSTPSSDGQMDNASAAGIGIGGILIGIAYILLIVNQIFTLINIYRAWACLQPGAPRTTPGKAIGFMFIPFFNIYWIFVAIGGLPKDWNRICASYEGLESAPRMSEGLFLAYLICSIVPLGAPAALVIHFIIMSQICKGVNFFAYRKNPQGGVPGFGGVRFG